MVECLKLHAPIAPSGHFPRKRGKKSHCQNQKPVPPLLAGEVSAKLTEGGRVGESHPSSQKFYAGGAQ